MNNQHIREMALGAIIAASAVYTLAGPVIKEYLSSTKSIQQEEFIDCRMPTDEEHKYMDNHKEIFVLQHIAGTWNGLHGNQRVCSAVEMIHNTQYNLEQDRLTYLQKDVLSHEELMELNALEKEIAFTAVREKEIANQIGGLACTVKDNTIYDTNIRKILAKKCADHEKEFPTQITTTRN